MAQPELIKDIEARVIRPASTDNAIVRFDGTTGLILNSTSLINDVGILDVTDNTGGFRKNYTTASSVPALAVGSYNQDIDIIKVWSSDVAQAQKGVYGYSLRYRGTGSGRNNFLTLYTDNNAASSQNIGWSVDQYGLVGIRTDAVDGYSLYVNGVSYFNNTITASKFIGNLEGNATSATQDGNGAVISSTYLPLSGGTMSGRINLPYNSFLLQFRSSGADIDSAYNTGTYYSTLGNECLAFVARLSVTSFMFVTGSDPAGWTSSTWNSSSPALLIKGQSVYVNSLIANGVSPSYNFYVNGTSYFSGTVISTAMFKGDTSAAGILPLLNNEINFASNGSTIWFGYRTLGSNAVSVYRFGNSAGSATGAIYAGTVYGAVWNDYAEYRKAESIEPGRVVIENEDGEMKLSTDRLLPGAEIISDTFGFAIGETDDYKTPIAAAGRVLAYPNEDRYSYPLGCAVCSGPNGTVSQMTREEIKEYPERIIGTVSEIPEYKNWGTGNVEVNGRIWIRIK